MSTVLIFTVREVRCGTLYQSTTNSESEREAAFK